MPATAALLPPTAAPAPAARASENEREPTASSGPVSDGDRFADRLHAEEAPAVDAASGPDLGTDGAEAPADTASDDSTVLADLALLAMPLVVQPPAQPIPDPLAGLAIAGTAGEEPAAAALQAALTAGDAAAADHGTGSPKPPAIPPVAAPAQAIQATRPAPVIPVAAAPATTSLARPTDGAGDGAGDADGDEDGLTGLMEVTGDGAALPLVQAPSSEVVASQAGAAPAVVEPAPASDGDRAVPGLESGLPPQASVPRPASQAIDSAPQAAPARPAAEPNPAERALASQVARAVLHHDPQGGRMLVVRLTPPELGTVRVEIIERAGVLTARISSEDDAVRGALERALPQMQKELRGSDAPVRDVALADGWFGDAARRGRNGAENQGRRRGRDDGAVFTLDGAAPVAAAILPLHRLGGVVAADRVDARA